MTRKRQSRRLGSHNLSLWIALLALLGACQDRAPDAGGPASPVASAPIAASSSLPDATSGEPPASLGSAGASAPASPRADDAERDETDETMTPRWAGLPTGPAQPETPADQQLERSIPTDTRAVREFARATPISGGTLVLTADGLTAIAADPDRDRLSIVDLFTQRLVSTIALEPGDEPGRLAVDAANRVHVVLRRGGAVVSVDLATRQIVARRAVCPSPRGIAYDASSQQLKVACAGGELISMPAAGGEISERVQVATDLRDVLVQPSATFVSRLKEAELVQLDAGGKPVRTFRPASPPLFIPDADGSQVVDTFEPRGARRTVPLADGGALMLHQGARNGDIDVQGPEAATTSTSISPYGGAGSCSRVVTPALTRFNAWGAVMFTASFDAVLAVDVAQSSANGEIAVALAGAADLTQPAATVQPKGTVPSAGASLPPDPSLAPNGAFDPPTIIRFHSNNLEPVTQGSQPTAPNCAFPMSTESLPATATAVAYSNARLVVQVREPAALFILDSVLASTGAARVEISLGGASVFDTGHEIFHRDAGGGIACASCHIEAGDDGHVWHFTDQGARRTQSMFVGLEGTAPFHWVGDMSDLTTLMDNVFVGRMGGVHQSAERTGALERWLYALQAPPPLRANTDAAATRGQALFQGEAECAKCHSGPKLTDNKTVDVGTGVELQVPSLVGVAYRGPWLHDGCAQTLRERFNPDCGGNRHGQTAQLSTSQIDDLIAYLETL